jgi:aldehyde dehydrogenase (NAD+)
MFEQLVQQQREYFARRNTRSLEFRKNQLNRLLAEIKKRESSILEALSKDLGKPAFEGYLGEVGFIYDEIHFALKHLSGWVKPRRVKTPPLLWLGKSQILSEPKGNVLIIGPWNYPFQLMVAPLISAIAAGNTAILKPSEIAPQTAKIISELVVDCFEPEFVAVVPGGAEVSSALLAQRFDHIFYTGGETVGKVVLRAAAEFLTPVTLELGGKSPCLIDDETDLKVTAKRLVWGKFFNAGQTCVAPDYCLVSHQTKPRLIEALVEVVKEFFGEDPRRSPDFSRIINEHHFKRLTALLGDGEVVIGGVSDITEKYISPTLLDNILPEHKIMQSEIFGPLLPILAVENLDAAIGFVNSRPKPLALYFFSNNRENQKKVLNEISYGGGCINDTLVHLTNPSMPFGGVGASGMGAYHGIYGFDTFSHQKSVVKRSFLFDPSLRYPPYLGKLKWVKKLVHG